LGKQIAYCVILLARVVAPNVLIGRILSSAARDGGSYNVYCKNFP
jgi:hypothetical protein